MCRGEGSHGTTKVNPQVPSSNLQVQMSTLSPPQGDSRPPHTGQASLLATQAITQVLVIHSAPSISLTRPWEVNCHNINKGVSRLQPSSRPSHDYMTSNWTRHQQLPSSFLVYRPTVLLNLATSLLTNSSLRAHRISPSQFCTQES